MTRSLDSARRSVVAVLGSGRDEHVDLAGPVGELLGLLGVHLLTGGGRGVMQAVARSFVAVEGRPGLSLGVLPADLDEPARPPEGYPNLHVELAIRTHLPHRGSRGSEPLSRNHVVVLTADFLVFLPGGPGTRSEAELALRYGKQAVALFPAGRDPSGFPPSIPRVRSVEGLRGALKAAFPS